MNKNLNIYIATSDSNVFIIKYFQYFFNKYWDEKTTVTVLGFTKPKFKLKKNFKFISLAKKQRGGFNCWSNYLINFFSTIKDKYFIFGIDDFMIARPVNHKILQTCISILNNDIGRIDLQPMQYARHPSLFKFYSSINNVKFYELSQGHLFRKTYRVSGAFSIWNKDWFLKNIDKYMTPWEWEIKGSLKANNDGFKVLCTFDQWSVKKLEVLSNAAWPGYINITGLRKQDINIMKKLVAEDDRVTKFKSLPDKKFYYEEYAGKDWLKTIFGK